MKRLELVISSKGCVRLPTKIRLTLLKNVCPQSTRKPVTRPMSLRPTRE